VEQDVHPRKTSDVITNSISKESIRIQIRSFPWSINLDENNPVHSRMIYVIQFMWHFIAQSILMLYFVSLQFYLRNKNHYLKYYVT